MLFPILLQTGTLALTVATVFRSSLSDSSGAESHDGPIELQKTAHQVQSCFLEKMC